MNHLINAPPYVLNTDSVNTKPVGVLMDMYTYHKVTDVVIACSGHGWRELWLDEISHLSMSSQLRLGAYQKVNDRND